MKFALLTTVAATLLLGGCATTDVSSQMPFREAPKAITTDLGKDGQLTEISAREGAELKCFNYYRPGYPGGTPIEVGVPPHPDKSDKGKGSLNAGGPLVGQAFHSYVVEGLLGTEFYAGVLDLTDGNFLGLAKHLAGPNPIPFYIPQWTIEGQIPDVQIHGGAGGEIGNSGVYVYNTRYGFVMVYSIAVVENDMTTGKRTVRFKKTISKTISQSQVGLQFDGLINDNLSRLDLTKKEHVYLANAMQSLANVAVAEVTAWFAGKDSNCYTGEEVKTPLSYQGLMFKNAVLDKISRVEHRMNIRRADLREKDLGPYLRERRMILSALGAGEDSQEMRDLLAKSVNENGQPYLQTVEGAKIRVEKLDKIIQRRMEELGGFDYPDDPEIKQLQAALNKLHQEVNKVDYLGDAPRTYPVLGEILGLKKPE